MSSLNPIASQPHAPSLAQIAAQKPTVSLSSDMESMKPHFIEKLSQNLKAVSTSIRRIFSSKTKDVAKTTSEISTLSPQHVEILEPLFSAGVLSKTDPLSEVFLNQLGKMCDPTKVSEEFIQSTLKELASGNLSTAIMVQTFQSSDSVQASLNPVLEKLAAHGNHSAQYELHMTTHVLCQHLETLGLHHLSGVVFDVKTVQGLMKAIGSEAQNYSVLFGKLMCLQHALSGKSGIENDLAACGISLSKDDSSAFYDKGITGDGHLKKAAESVRKMASSLASTKGLRDSVRRTFTSDETILSAYFQRHAMTKLLKLTGTDDAQLKSLHSLIGKNVDVSRKAIHIVRLAIANVVQSAEPLTIDAVNQQLKSFDLSDTQIQSLSRSATKEVKEFSGADSLHTWMSDLSIKAPRQSEIQHREFVENKAELRSITGQETLASREVTSWISGIGNGGSLAIDWGKKISVSVPTVAKAATASFLAGQSIGGGVDFSSKKSMMIQKEPGGFSLVMHKDTAIGMRLEVDALYGLLSGAGEAKTGSRVGIKLHFDSQEKISQFLTGLWTNQPDSSTINDVSAILFQKGTEVAVSGKAMLSVKNAASQLLAGVSIGMAPNIPLPGRPDLGGMPTAPKVGVEVQSPVKGPSTDLSASKTRETQWTESKNATEHVFEKTVTQSFQVGFEGSPLERTGIVQTHTEVNFSNGFLSSVQLTQTGQFGGLKVGTLDNEIQHLVPKELHEKAEQLKSSAKAGDKLQIVWELPLSSRLEVAQMMDKTSASYNPKKAQSLLADTKNYVATAIELLRPTEHSKETNALGVELDVLAITHQQRAEKVVIVDRVLVS